MREIPEQHKSFILYSLDEIKTLMLFASKKSFFPLNKFLQDVK